jgi:hypothetical protein
VRPARRADNLCRHLVAVCLSNVRTLTSRNPMGLHGLQQGYLYFYFTFLVRLSELLKILKLTKRHRAVAGEGAIFLIYDIADVILNNTCFPNRTKSFLPIQTHELLSNI